MRVYLVPVGPISDPHVTGIGALRLGTAESAKSVDHVAEVPFYVARIGLIDRRDRPDPVLPVNCVAHTPVGADLHRYNDELRPTDFMLVALEHRDVKKFEIRRRLRSIAGEDQQPVGWDD